MVACAHQESLMTPPMLPWKTAASTCSVGIADPAWPLAAWVGEDHPDRTYHVPVRFDVPFGAVPVVQVALMGLDHDQRTSGRVRLRVSEVTPEGFTVGITTWRDTRVYGVDFGWLALGE